MDIYQLIIYLLIVLFGLSVGSFLNVVIARFDDMSSILKTRSHCPHCKKNLPWYDLIPFFSYILLAGKCRECKKVISLQYPIVEIVTAILFVLIYQKFGFSLESLFLLIIFSTLIVIAAYDILHSKIPDVCSYIAIFFAIGFIVYKLLQNQDLGNTSVWLSYAYGLAIGLGFFGLLVIVSREKWMGAGDAILGAFMGILLGYPNIIVALFLAFILGSLTSLLLIAVKKKNFKDAIPFGPFLVGATIIAFFWGQEVLNIYLLRMGL